jgi:tRNA 2-thiouridine synthesizing protein A
MFASTLSRGSRTWAHGGHDALMTGRRFRIFGRAAESRGTGPGAASVSPAAPPEAGRAMPPAAGRAPVLTIDALGRKCPIPIIMLAEQIRDVPLGSIVAVLADDPAAYTDVPSWCVMKAHEFAGYEELTRGWALFIRRAV